MRWADLERTINLGGTQPLNIVTIGTRIADAFQAHLQWIARGYGASDMDIKDCGNVLTSLAVATHVLVADLRPGDRGLRVNATRVLLNMLAEVLISADNVFDVIRWTPPPYPVMHDRDKSLWAQMVINNPSETRTAAVFDALAASTAGIDWENIPNIRELVERVRARLHQRHTRIGYKTRFDRVFPP